MTTPPYPFGANVLHSGSWAPIVPQVLQAGVWKPASSGTGGGSVPAGMLGLTTFMTGLSNDQAVTQWSGITGASLNPGYSGGNVLRPVGFLKWYNGGAGLSDGTGKKKYFPQPTSYAQCDPVIQCCLDLGLEAFMCYKPTYNASTFTTSPKSPDWLALQASLTAYAALGLPMKVIFYQETEHVVPTPAQYFAALAYYGSAVTSVLSPPCIYHDASGNYSGKWAGFFPGPPNTSSPLVHGAGIDFYGQSYNAPPNGSSVRLNPYLALCGTAGVPFMGVFEMGVSIANGPVPPNSVMYGYLTHITSFAYAGATYAWYQQQNLNIANLIPGYASGQVATVYVSKGVQATQAGPNCIPYLQALADIITP